MKKWLIPLLALLIMAGCQNENTKDPLSEMGFSKKEIKQLEEYGVSGDIEKKCKYPKTVKQMLKDDFKKEYASSYCDYEDVNNSIAFNALLEAGASKKDIKAYLKIPYLRAENVNRYLSYGDQTLSKKDIVKEVNLNLDLKPYEDVSEVENTGDVTMLVNKFNKLPDGYVPENVIDTPSVCIVGVHYSCFPNAQYIVKEAGEAFDELISAGAEQGVKITAIASLRDYNYQKSLYDYYLSSEGQEYADQYFARPGQSEHNTGLAVDITLDDMDYTTIEENENYEWLLEHLADYGFILRYPADKEKETGFSHESWHLRYVGKNLAKLLYKNNITLDEYYAMKEAYE